MTLKVTGFKTRERTYDMDGARGLRKRSTAYVSIESESFWEEFGNRTSRPSRLWHPVVLEELKRQGVNVEKMAWNPRAGCSCPCSPGFSITGDTGKDYWVTLEVEDESEKTENPDEATSRLTQILADPTMPVGTPEAKQAAREALSNV